jgi:glutamyl-tRNA reductase
MKTAYQAAYDAGTLGKRLGKLFQHTFTAAKKVRNCHRLFATMQ